MLRGGIPIGKAFGISMRLHYSWFIIFALITFALAAGYFPSAQPTWNLATRVIAGLLTSILFFASVLAHELMHSIIAQRNGIPIQSITLFILGGVSQMTKEPETPAVEFRMALAGPLTSLVLGAVFYGIYYLTYTEYPFIYSVALYLGYINVFLGIFNIIPGFPLDGGRILRSIIWGATNNLRRSTKIAANIGRGIGYLFIFAGIFLVFGGNILGMSGWVNGIWIAFIGWFLENTAVGSYRQLALHEVLKGHQASEIMSRDCVMVSGDMTVERLINEQILTSGRRCFPVTSMDYGVIGMVTLQNVKSVPQELRSTRTISEVMTPFDKLKKVKPTEDLSTVLQILTESDINQVPVVGEDGKNIVGMVSRDTLLTFIDIRGGMGA